MKAEKESIKNDYVTPSTPITPVKIQRFDDFLSFVNNKRLDLGTIQFVTLSNGIFEKG